MRAKVDFTYADGYLEHVSLPGLPWSRNHDHEAVNSAWKQRHVYRVGFSLDQTWLRVILLPFRPLLNCTEIYFARPSHETE